MPFTGHVLIKMLNFSTRMDAKAKQSRFLAQAKSMGWYNAMSL